MTQRPVGVLESIAIGDAYGAAFEFTKTPDIANDLGGYGTHGLGELPRAAYTDDTIRSMANAQVLLGGDPFDPACYVSAYQRAHDADGRAGWSSRFQKFLDDNRANSATTFMRSLERRPTNGCVMGVAVLGHLTDARDVRLATTMQTVSTHSAAAAVYAQTVSLAAHHLIHGGNTVTALDYVLAEAEWENDKQRDRFRRMAQDPGTPEMQADTIAAGALWAIGTFDGMSEMLIWACSSGRDCDSMGAVTMALGHLACDIADDLPDVLRDGWDEEHNRRAIREIDRMLLERFDQA